MILCYSCTWCLVPQRAWKQTVLDRQADLIVDAGNNVSLLDTFWQKIKKREYGALVPPSLSVREWGVLLWTEKQSQLGPSVTFMAAWPTLEQNLFPAHRLVLPCKPSCLRRKSSKTPSPEFHPQYPGPIFLFLKRGGESKMVGNSFPVLFYF